MPFRVVLRSSQRDVIEKSPPVATRLEAYEIGKSFFDLAAARDEKWFHGEIVSVAIEEVTGMSPL
jgi:hypothetical protein